MNRVAAAFALWLCAAMPAFAQIRENLPVIGIMPNESGNMWAMVIAVRDAVIR